jgi:hypothetical protein
MHHLFFHDRRPPNVTIQDELGIVLRVAFGDQDKQCGAPESYFGARHVAQQLGLAAACDARVQQASAPKSVIDDCVRGAVNAVESDKPLSNDPLAPLQDATERLGIDVVLFDPSYCMQQIPVRKAASGTEFVVLLDESGCRKLVQELSSSGWTECAKLPSGRRCAAAVLDMPGAPPVSMVLQTHLQFVRMVPGGAFVDFECLRRCGQLALAKEVGGGRVWQASSAVQAAWVASQALVEHRFSPEYSAFGAMLAAQKLGLHHDEDLAFDTYLLVQTDVEYSEFDAWRELIRALAQGKLSSLSTNARCLLSHAVASATNQTYRTRLLAQRKLQRWQHDGYVDRAAERAGRLIAKIKHR